jgi:hypothetical protein
VDEPASAARSPIHGPPTINPRIHRALKVWVIVSASLLSRSTWLTAEA